MVPAAQAHAVGEGLDEVLGLSAATGRMLNTFDRRAAAPTAVIGHDLAKRIAVVGGQPRTITIDDQVFAVVGTLHPAPVRPRAGSRGARDQIRRCPVHR